MLKGDGNLDDANVTRMATMWWSQDIFMKLLAPDPAKPDTPRCRVINLMYSANIESIYSVKEFENFAYNPETKRVDRHKYWKTESGEVGYQANREDASVIENETFENAIKRIIPASIMNYFYAWPMYMYIDGENYHNSLPHNGGKPVLAHAPGYNIQQLPGGMYSLIREQTFVNVPIEKYAERVYSGEVDLTKMPEHVEPAVPAPITTHDDWYQILPRNRRAVAL